MSTPFATGKASKKVTCAFRPANVALAALFGLFALCGTAPFSEATSEIRLREVAIHYVRDGRSAEGSIAVTVDSNGEGRVTSFDLRLPVQTHAVVKNIGSRFKIAGVEMALLHEHTGGGKLIPNYEPLRGWGGEKTANRERFIYEPLPGLNTGVANHAIEQCRQALAAGSSGRQEISVTVNILMRVTAVEGDAAWPFSNFVPPNQNAVRTANTSARIRIECQAVSHIVEPDFWIDDFSVRLVSNPPGCPRPYQVSAISNARRVPVT